MNRQWIAVMLALGFVLGPVRVAAQDVNVDVNAGGGEVRGIDYFYEALSQYGDWVNTADYGWAWVPASTPEGWRPYTNGQWVYTDDYGWTWASDDAWGWATDHYGRWYFDDDYGWAWVPGTHWGPAWVAWREGEGCIGWAPLPPEGRAIDFGPTISLNIGDDVIGRLRPYEWCFVRERDFTAPRCSAVLLRGRESLTILDRTKNITHYTVTGDRVFNRSVDRKHIEEQVGRPIQPVKVRAAGSPGENGRVEGNAIGVYRPRIEQRGAVRSAPPPQVVEKSRAAGDRIKQRHQNEVKGLTGAGYKIEPRTRRPGGPAEIGTGQPPREPVSPKSNRPTEKTPEKVAPERTLPPAETKGERSKPAPPPERTLPAPETKGERSKPAPPPERTLPAPETKGERGKPVQPPERVAPAPGERPEPAQPSGGEPRRR